MQKLFSYAQLKCPKVCHFKYIHVILTYSWESTEIFMSAEYNTYFGNKSH